MQQVRGDIGISFRAERASIHEWHGRANLVEEPANVAPAGEGFVAFQIDLNVDGPGDESSSGRSDEVSLFGLAVIRRVAHTAVAAEIALPALGLRLSVESVGRSAGGHRGLSWQESHALHCGNVAFQRLRSGRKAVGLQKVRDDVQV